MNFESHLDKNETLRALTLKLRELIVGRETEHFTLALSGGSTAKEMFAYWAGDKAPDIPWRSVKFFWVDERCVPPDDGESNFRHANEIFFRPLKISEENIFRIMGEADPHAEAERYSRLSAKAAGGGAGLPDFDCTILGMGSDGHTASIFPGNTGLLHENSAYAVSEHPQTKQRRITMTGPCILNSHQIFLPVLGTDKADILELAVSQTKSGETALPSAYIMRNSENITIFTDALKLQISG